MEKVKEVKVLNYNGTSIRSVENNGETWLMLKDVYKALGNANSWRKNPNYEKSKICDGEIDKFSLSSSCLGPMGFFVNPQGLLSLLERKKKLKKAKSFKEWFEKTCVSKAVKVQAFAFHYCDLEDIVDVGYIKAYKINEKFYFEPYGVGAFLEFQDKYIDDYLKNADDTKVVYIDLSDLKLLTEKGVCELVFKSVKDSNVFDTKIWEFAEWIADIVLPFEKDSELEELGFYAFLFTETFMKHLRDFIEERQFKIETQKIQIERLERLNREYENGIVESNDNYWHTIQRVAKLNGIDSRDISWRRLEDTSYSMELEVKWALDPYFGRVPAYHIDVWKYEYLGLRFEEKKDERIESI